MAKMLVKTISLALAGLMLFTLCSCASKKNKEKSSSPVSVELTLPFCSTDSYVPYSAKTETNILLSSLVFDSLFVVNSDRSISGKIAESYVKQDKQITVTLSDVKFSDGSALTSNDVVHSFSLAKQSERFRASLQDFEGAVKKGNKVVRFNLSSKNVYALSLLTFPIVKQSNNHIGSGLYKFSEEDGKTFLEYNRYNALKKPKIERFNLLECKEYSSAVNLFNDGKISFLFDTLSDGNIRSNAINSTKAKLNNLIFLGLNSKKGMLKNSRFRAAVSLALNQTELCEEALGSFAIATSTPFDPEWNEIGAVVSNSVLSKENEAREEFLNSGCEYDKMDVNLLSGGKAVELTLIVNSANNMKIALAEQIKAQLVNYGISIELKKMPLDEYNIAIENENFDMYIGEVKIQNDFNLEAFFTDGGGADFGINTSSIGKTYLLFKSGGASLQDFVSAFSEQNPFIPIGYKCADVCFDSSLKVSGNITENDIYNSIEEWSR